MKSPVTLNGEQIWKLFKGDRSGAEISIDFIQDFCSKKKISLDMDGFNEIFLNNNEKALKNMKNVRKDNTILIELSTKLKKNSIRPTLDSFKYDFQVDSSKCESNYKSSILLKLNWKNILSLLRILPHRIYLCNYKLITTSFENF